MGCMAHFWACKRWELVSGGQQKFGFEQTVGANIWSRNQRASGLCLTSTINHSICQDEIWLVKMTLQRNQDLLTSETSKSLLGPGRALKKSDNLFASYVFSWWCWDTFEYEPKPWTWTSSLKHFREHFVWGELNGTKVNGPITVFLIDDLRFWRSFCSTQQPPNTFQWLWNHPTRCCTLFEHKGFLSQAVFWPKSFGKITYEQIII
jgi:hypothetical protein